MRFPVVVRTPEARPPRARLYYELASNGLFQVKETEGFRAVTRVDGGVPGLEPSREELELRFPPLPARLLENVLAFFRAVFEEHDGEAIVVLYHRPRDGEWSVVVPEQRVPGYVDDRGRWRGILRLEYGHAARPEGFLRFGSIHSHAELPATASATDCRDEAYEEGLHVVFGHLDREKPSASAAFVVSGRRFFLDPDVVLEPFVSARRPPPPEWMARVSREERYGVWTRAWGESWGSALEGEAR